MVFLVFIRTSKTIQITSNDKRGVLLLFHIRNTIIICKNNQNLRYINNKQTDEHKSRNFTFTFSVGWTQTWQLEQARLASPATSRNNAHCFQLICIVITCVSYDIYFALIFLLCVTNWYVINFKASLYVFVYELIDVLSVSIILNKHICCLHILIWHNKGIRYKRRKSTFIQNKNASRFMTIHLTI